MADTKSRFHARLGDIELIALSEDRSLGVLFCDPQGSVVLPGDIPALIEALQMLQAYLQLDRPPDRDDPPPAPNGNSPRLNAG